MARELRSGKKLKAPKVSKTIQKPKKPIKSPKKAPEPVRKGRSQARSIPQKKVVSKKKILNIKKTRSIQDVQQQGLNFLKSSSKRTRAQFTLSKLSKQSKTLTRSKDPSPPVFTMKTRSKDPKKTKKEEESSSDEESEEEEESKSASDSIEEEDNSSDSSDSSSSSEEEEAKKEEPKRVTRRKSNRDLKKDYNMGPQLGLIDVVFCCDTTCSMDSYIAEVKKAINQISQNIVSKVGLEGIDVKFGFVGYQDHKPQSAKYVTKVLDLDTDVNMMKLIAKESCYGGGDTPEAVLDGLYDSATKISWRKSKGTPTLRYIYHICDAPPHGDLYGGYSTNFKKGCPCKLTAEKIGAEFVKQQIHYRLIKTYENGLEKMTEIFKKNFRNFDECTLKQAFELNVRVSDMFNNEVFPEYN